MRKRNFVALTAAIVIISCNREPKEQPQKVTVASKESFDVEGKLGQNLSAAKLTNPKAHIEQASFAAPPTSNLTAPQANAVRSAKQYLRMTGFSRDGLIQQLSSDAGEGYSVEDATVAVDSLDVDWNENAARSARQYLSMSGFSCNGLIEQLSSDAGEKYTLEQATYGAHEAGAC